MSNKILIIDDNDDFRSSLSETIQKGGYEVVNATDGYEGMVRFRENVCDLVICDLNMPGISGIETLSRIHSVNPDIPSFLISGCTALQAPAQSISNTPFEILEKPVKSEVILDYIHKALHGNDEKYLSAAYHTSQEVLHSDTSDHLYPAILQMSHRLLRSDQTGIVLAAAEGLSLIAGKGFTDTDHEHRALETLNRIVKEIGIFFEPLYSRDTLDSTQSFNTLFQQQGLTSVIIHPLFAEKELLGFLHVQRTRKADLFTKQDFRLTAIIASQLSQAMKKDRLQQQLQQRATELENARHVADQALQDMVQASKLAVMGEMAAGVVHELNNPMSSILGYSQVLLSASETSAWQREHLLVIESQAKRCRALLWDLLELGRAKKQKMDTVDLIPVIRTAIQFMGFELSRSSVTLVEDLPEKLPEVDCDPNQIQQILINLIANAQHAMQKSSPRLLTVKAEASPDHLCIHVQDTGTGIPPDIQERIFEPFFTTKPPGQGTGLGLSICRRIMEQHMGALQVTSEVGKGTTFTMTFFTRH